MSDDVFLEGALQDDVKDTDRQWRATPSVAPR
jgi:hypothetical protein